MLEEEYTEDPMNEEHHFPEEHHQQEYGHEEEYPPNEQQPSPAVYAPPPPVVYQQNQRQPANPSYAPRPAGEQYQRQPVNRVYAPRPASQPYEGQFPQGTGGIRMEEEESHVVPVEHQQYPVKQQYQGQRVPNQQQYDQGRQQPRVNQPQYHQGPPLNYQQYPQQYQQPTPNQQYPMNQQYLQQPPNRIYPAANHQNLNFPQPGQGTWSTDLFDCFTDVPLCCLACWCPCIAFGRIAEIADKGSSTCSSTGSIYTVILVLTGCQCIYSGSYRTKMRREYGIPGDDVEDFCTHFWCEGCALLQEYKELTARGYDVPLGWYGNINLARKKQSQGVHMPPVAPNGMTR